MLKLDNVSAGYGKVEVVKNITLEVADGASLCVIGPNGCGKTTLLKAIASVIPYSGSVKIDETELRGMRQKEISRKISLLSQNTGVYFSYSVFDTVMMGRYLHIHGGFFGLPSDKDRECVESCLRSVDLLDVQDKELTKLSGGQLQRVFLARAFAQEPKIILLDEPTNHLDLKYQIELMDYLNEWAKSGEHSIIGVMHDINLAMRLSGNIMVMKDGISVAYGKSDGIVTGKLLRTVYDIDVAGYMKGALKMWDGLAE